MQTDIYYRDITRTENLENYLMEKVVGAIEEFFVQDPNAHVTVRVETDRHRTDVRKPHYSCEVILKPSRLKKVIKVRKNDQDFRICVAKTVAALKASVSREVDRRTDRRKRMQNPNLLILDQAQDQDQAVS